MPYKARSNKKQAIQSAVSKNIQGLVSANKFKPKSQQRTISQIRAIAFNQARPKKK